MRKILLTEEQLQWYKDWNKKYRDGIRYVPTGETFDHWFYRDKLIVTKPTEDALDLRTVGCGEDSGNSKVAFAKWDK